MPVTTRNEFSHLYKKEDWNCTERIQLPPRTPVLLTGFSSGEGLNRYVLVWALVGEQCTLGWLWEKRLEPTSYAQVVNLREKYPQGKTENYKLYRTQKSTRYKNCLLERLEAIQQLLADRDFVRAALTQLEHDTAAGVRERQLPPTGALDIALGQMEQRWALKARLTLRTTAKEKKPESRHQDEQVIIGADGPLIFQKQFLEEAVQQAVPIRDIGAPPTHGEYAHRIQWYIIAHYFLEVWTSDGLRYAHRAMGGLRYLQELGKPTRSDDAYRSLWDYVVDVRLLEAEEVGDTSGVYAASPVRLTSRLLGYDFLKQKNTLGDLAVEFKTVARAVASKRRKRVLENKVRENKELTEIERTHLSDDGGREARELWLQKTFTELFSA